MTGACSGGGPARFRLAFRLASTEEIEELADAALSADLVSQRDVALNVVAVPPAVPLLHHVPGLGEVRQASGW